MKTVARITWNTEREPAANAARILPPLVAAWFADGRKVASEAPVAEDLHRFRLDGKRLRYSLEIFSPCFGRGITRYLDILRGAQGRLGEYNDCMTLLRLLDELPGDAAHKKKAADFLGKRASGLYQDFVSFWTAQVDRKGAEAAWIRFLGRQPVRTRPAKRVRGSATTSPQKT